MKWTFYKRTDGWATIMLAGLTLAVFWKVINCDFVYFDDPEYVFENLRIQGGLSWENVLWAFKSTYLANWHPLTWISYLLDREVYGMNPSGYHLTNLLFHLANGLLLFTVLRRMTGAVWRSFLVAALFGIHPLHVESVAWISERKDVLSTFFWFLALGAYDSYVRNPGWRRYSLVLGLFVMGLMSKPMLVSLPALLLFLDYWPLKRVDRWNAWGQWKRLLREKIPLIVLAAISCGITFWAQREAGSVPNLEHLSLWMRIVNAVSAYQKYLVMMIWPGDLACYYPYRWEMTNGLSAVSALLGISAFVVLKGERYRYLTLGWLWYLVTLVPVIGLVQVGMQAMADRYTYVPLVGVFIMLVWGVAEGAVGKMAQRVLAAAGSGVVLIYGICAWHQAGYWKNSVTLFEHAIQVTTGNAIAHSNLGRALTNQKQFALAIEHCGEAIKLYPDLIDAYNNLGVIFIDQGRYVEAIDCFSEALRRSPGQGMTHYNLGRVLARQGKLSEAAIHFKEALKSRPGLFEAHNNLGIVLSKQGRSSEAIGHFFEALRINPHHANAHYNLGTILLDQGMRDEAISHLKEAVKIKPDLSEAWYNLGLALEKQGRKKEAQEAFLQAGKLPK